MNELELKALREEIANEQKKQSDILADIKARVDKGEDYAKKWEDLQKNITALSAQADALELSMKDKTFGQKKSMFDEMKKTMTDKGKVAEIKAGKAVSFELKASTIDEATELSNSALTTAVIIPQREPGVGKAPDRATRILDLVSRGTVNSNRLTWVERSARTEGQAAVAEGNQYGQSDFTWIMKSQPVEKIGTYIKITNEALEDWDQVLTEIYNELVPMLERTIEAGVYSGTGTSPALQGITDTGFAQAYSCAGLSASVISPNHLDAIVAAYTQLALLNYMPDSIVVNPVDRAKMILPKNADGLYLLPPFSTGNGQIVNGVKVVESNLVTAGDFLIGEFKRDLLAFKRGIEIKIWDQDSTDPEYDLKTITASVRCVNRIKAPDCYAFVYDQFADVISDLTV